MSQGLPEAIYDRLSDIVEILGSRLVILTVLMPDDSGRVVLFGAGSPPDLGAIEDLFGDTLDALESDVNFMEIKGNA